MPVLLLSRPTPLTSAEVARLPRGCVATDGAGGVVARAEVDLPPGALLAFAVAMGRAVPDAAFAVQEGVVAPPPSPPPDAENITEHDPWKLVAAGRIAEAEKVFAAGLGLDAAGRDRVRSLWRSVDPEQAALGCRIARASAWKAAATDVRRLLSHAHPVVRREAAATLGEIAGPSLAMAVRPLVDDPDAEVREAARAAVKRLGG